MLNKLFKNFTFYAITGKSLICKEKASQTVEKEKIVEDIGLKLKADPVFFLSMVGIHVEYVEEMGNNVMFVAEHEHIFDIYSKEYDFHGTDVKVISAQDLWTFYESRNKGANPKHYDIYFLIEYFVKHHPNGHFILDEFPIMTTACKCEKVNSISKYCNYSSLFLYFTI